MPVSHPLPAVGGSGERWPSAWGGKAGEGCLFSSPARGGGGWRCRVREAERAPFGVTIKWKGSTANQTFFTLWRRVGNLQQWSQVGSVAVKSFRDETVPASVPSVSYIIRAQRNNTVSAASDEATVNFGGGQLLAA